MHRVHRHVLYDIQSDSTKGSRTHLFESDFDEFSNAHFWRHEVGLIPIARIDDALDVFELKSIVHRRRAHGKCQPVFKRGAEDFAAAAAARHRSAEILLQL